MATEAPAIVAIVSAIAALAGTAAAVASYRLSRPRPRVALDQFSYQSGSHTSPYAPVKGSMRRVILLARPARHVPLGRLSPVWVPR